MAAPKYISKYTQPLPDYCIHDYSSNLIFKTIVVAECLAIGICLVLLLFFYVFYKSKKHAHPLKDAIKICRPWRITIFILFVTTAIILSLLV